MEISTTILKHCDLITVKGRVDSSTAPKPDEALKEVVGMGHFRIVLDLSGVEFLGSAGLRAIVSAFKTCRRWNRGDVRLAELPPRVKGVLDLAGITPLVQIFPEVVLAVGSF